MKSASEAKSFGMSVFGPKFIKLDPGAHGHDGRLPAVEQRVSGQVLAALFAGLEEDYAIAVEGVELRAVRPPSGVRSGDTVEVSSARRTAWCCSRRSD